MVFLSPSLYAAAPRIDTFYDTPEGKYYQYMNILLTWERIPSGADDINATFFFLFQQPSSSYEGGIGYSDGKISLRQQDRRRFAVFSINDSHLNSQTAYHEREMTWCKRFQSNGESGTQCIIEYAWEEGRVYMLQIKYDSSVGSTDIWQASVIDVETEAETSIGRIHLQKVDMKQGYGLIRENPVTYLEYFGNSNRCQGLLPVRVSWLGPFDEKAAPLPIGARSQKNECNASSSSTSVSPIVVQEVAVSPNQGIPDGEDFWPLLTKKYFKPSLSTNRTGKTYSGFIPPSNQVLTTSNIQANQPSQINQFNPYQANSTAFVNKSLNSPLKSGLNANVNPQITADPQIVPNVPDLHYEAKTLTKASTKSKKSSFTAIPSTNLNGSQITATNIKADITPPTRLQPLVDNSQIINSNNMPTQSTAPPLIQSTAAGYLPVILPSPSPLGAFSPPYYQQPNYNTFTNGYANSLPNQAIINNPYQNPPNATANVAIPSPYSTLETSNNQNNPYNPYSAFPNFPKAPPPTPQVTPDSFR